MKTSIILASVATMMAGVASAARVTCGIITCGNYGNCNSGSGAGVILNAAVDGDLRTIQREAVCAQEAWPDCDGQPMGNGITMYLCGNNPFTLTEAGYCIYNGQRFDLKTQQSAVETCTNIFPQYGGPAGYDDSDAFQYTGFIDA